MKVLVTRPSDDAVATAGRLAELGHEVMVGPVLDIRYETGTLPDLSGCQALLATSRNGVRALFRANAPRDLPVMAVGRSTAALARESGFTQVSDADGDVDALVMMVAEQLKPDDGWLFHAVGSVQAGDLKKALEKFGFSVRREVLYRSVPARQLSPALQEALTARQIDAVLFFSPRSAEAFARLAAPIDGVRLACGKMTAICISERAARSLDPLSFRTVRVAGRPNQDELLACLAAIGEEEQDGQPE